MKFFSKFQKSNVMLNVYRSCISLWFEWMHYHATGRNYWWLTNWKKLMSPFKTVLSYGFRCEKSGYGYKKLLEFCSEIAYTKIFVKKLNYFLRLRKIFF